MKQGCAVRAIQAILATLHRLRRALGIICMDTVWQLHRRGLCLPQAIPGFIGEYAGLAPFIKPSQRAAYLMQVCHGAAEAGHRYDASGPSIDMESPNATAGP